MGNQTVVYDALKTSVEALGVTLGLKVAYLDDSFEADIDPTNTFEPYLQAKLFRNMPAWQGVNGAARLDQGLFQVDLVWPAGKPTRDSVLLVDNIIANYPKGSRVAASMLKVQSVPWAATSLVETDRTVTPITIPWTI